jgi:hypothetical protein
VAAEIPAAVSQARRRGCCRRQAEAHRAPAKTARVAQREAPRFVPSRRPLGAGKPEAPRASSSLRQSRAIGGERKRRITLRSFLGPSSGSSPLAFTAGVTSPTPSRRFAPSRSPRSSISCSRGMASSPLSPDDVDSVRRRRVRSKSARRTGRRPGPCMRRGSLPPRARDRGTGLADPCGVVHRKLY